MTSNEIKKALSEYGKKYPEHYAFINLISVAILSLDERIQKLEAKDFIRNEPLINDY